MADRAARRVAAAAAGLFALLVVPLVAVAGEPEMPVQRWRLDIVAQVPPDALDEIDVLLLDADGVDVLDEYCFLALDGYAQYLPGYRCDGIPDGDYSVELASIPEGFLVEPVDCFWGDDLDSGSFSLGVDQRSPDTCRFTATPPVVVIALDDYAGASPEAFLEFRNADDEPVDAACRPETRDGYRGHWCFGLPFGDYDVVLRGADLGYKNEVYCDPELDVSGSSDQYGGRVSLNTEQWYWSCVGTVVTPITIDFFSYDTGPIPLDQASFVVAGPAGDVTDQCVRVDVPEEEDYGLDDIVRFHCLDVPTGSYRVEPSEPFSDGNVPCVVDVGPSYWGQCEFYLTAPVSPPDEPADPVVTTPAPVVTSPTTTAAPPVEIAPEAADSTVADDRPTDDADRSDDDRDDGDGDGDRGGWLVALIAGVLGGIVGAAIATAVVLRRYTPRS